MAERKPICMTSNQSPVENEEEFAGGCSERVTDVDQSVQSLEFLQLCGEAEAQTHILLVEVFEQQLMCFSEVLWEVMENEHIHWSCDCLGSS